MELLTSNVLSVLVKNGPFVIVNKRDRTQSTTNVPFLQDAFGNITYLSVDVINKFEDNAESVQPLYPFADYEDIPCSANWSVTQKLLRGADNGSTIRFVSQKNLQCFVLIKIKKMWVGEYNETAHEYGFSEDGIENEFSTCP